MSYTILDPVTARHRIGKCPSCGIAVYADVSVAVEIGVPRMEDDGKPSVFSRAFPVACRIEHSCERKRDLW